MIWSPSRHSKATLESSQVLNRYVFDGAPPNVAGAFFAHQQGDAVVVWLGLVTCGSSYLDALAPGGG